VEILLPILPPLTEYHHSFSCSQLLTPDTQRSTVRAARPRFGPNGRPAEASERARSTHTVPKEKEVAIFTSDQRHGFFRKETKSGDPENVAVPFREPQLSIGCARPLSAEPGFCRYCGGAEIAEAVSWPQAMDTAESLQLSSHLPPKNKKLTVLLPK